MKGATGILPQNALDWFISIHAPMKGATYDDAVFELDYSFQSTHP